MRLPRSDIELTKTCLQLVAISLILGVLTYLSQEYCYLLASVSLIAYLAFSYADFRAGLKLLKTDLLAGATIEKRRVPVGRPVRVNLTVTNPLATPVRITGVEFALSSSAVKIVSQYAPTTTLQPKQRMMLPQELRTQTGGRLDIRRIAMRISDQRGLFSALVESPLEASVEVYPAPLPRKALTPMALYGGVEHRRISPTGVEYAGTRQYEQGDDLRKIDWKATARLTRLMVKEFHTEENFPVTILLDTGDSMNSPAHVGTRLDEAAAVAYLLSRVAIAQGDPVNIVPYNEDNLQSYMKPGSRRTQLAQILSILTKLSRKLEEREPAEPRRPRPLRTISREIEQLEVLKERAESAQYAEKVLSLLRLFRSAYFMKLREKGLYQAFTTISTSQTTSGLIVVLTDFQTQLDALIEGGRAMQRKGHRVLAVQICAPWRKERNLEKSYLEYRRNRRIHAELAANEILTIDAEPENVIDMLNKEMAKTRMLKFPYALR